MNTEQKLERWAEKQFKQHFDNIIIDGINDGYLAFGRFYIKPVGTIFEVWLFDNFQGNFGSKRSAISYCVAERFKQYNLSRQIKVLDNKKQELEADLSVSKRMANNTKNSEFKEIIYTKIANKESTNKLVSAELEKCLNSAKYLQLRGFSNETARTIRN